MPRGIYENINNIGQYSHQGALIKVRKRCQVMAKKRKSYKVGRIKEAGRLRTQKGSI